MTRYDIITLDSARGYFRDANIGDFICWEHRSEDSLGAHPFGMGCTPDQAFENGSKDIDSVDCRFRITYSIVVPEAMQVTPPQYVDFSIVFSEYDNLPHEFSQQHDLLFVYSNKKRAWLGTFSTREAVLDDLAEQNDLINSLIIDQRPERTGRFPLVPVPDFNLIELTRRCAGISEEEASKLIADDVKFWANMRSKKITMTTCQWNIFLQIANQHLAIERQELE